MAAAVIPTNPSCQGPFPDGKALLPALSTGIQVAALTQSWSRQAALSSLPDRDTGTHCLCNTPAVDFRPGRLLRTWNSQNTLQHAGWQNLGRVLPWQREFFQCQGDRTSEYSCTSFCSFLCSLLLWQCLSHVLPAGAARKVKFKEQEVPKELHLPGSQISTCRKEAELQAQAFKS